VFAVLYHIIVIFEFVRTITFGAFGSIDIAGKDSVLPSPTILAFGESRIHFSAPNGNEMTSDIE